VLSSITSNAVNYRQYSDTPILEEKIFHMAGATTPQQQTVAALEHAIREAGREPIQRDSHYRHISSGQKTDTCAKREPAELACA
jgi:hypothetical protein